MGSSIRLSTLHQYCDSPVKSVISFNGFVQQWSSKKAAADEPVKVGVYLQNRNLRTVMLSSYWQFSGRKRKKSATSNYLISTDPTELTRQADSFAGKLRSNLLGTAFTVYDNGKAWRKHDHSKTRHELAAVVYVSYCNIAGKATYNRKTNLQQESQHTTGIEIVRVNFTSVFEWVSLSRTLTYNGLLRYKLTF